MDGNKNNEMVDNPIVHWERLQDSGRKRMKLMEDEKEKLQKEIDTMNSVIGKKSSTETSNDGDDIIIEINAGGTIISALRSTLCLVASDTMFSYMFSGRWEKSLTRDSSGRIYLNHDPELIELIVNYLRTKAIEDPSSAKVLVCPKIPEGKEQAFEVLLNYFGLTDFFYPPVVFLPLDITNIDVVQPHGSAIKMTKSENKIQFLKIGNNYNHDFVACKPTLDSSGEGSFWKVTVNKLCHNEWLFLGIIGNLDAHKYSHEDSTSYGWVSTASSYHGGTHRIVGSGWKGINQGECLYFHLKSNKLTLFHVQNNKKFSIDIGATVGAYYIHFNMCYTNSMLTLEPLDEEERARFL